MSTTKTTTRQNKRRDDDDDVPSSGGGDDGEAAKSFENNPVHQAMEFIDAAAAYQIAVQRCPRVIETESPHATFLAFCNGNAWDAAARLAAYWNLRYKVFDDNQAFQPLNQGLTLEDKRYLKLGVHVVTGCNQDGVAIMASDRSRVPPKLPPATVRRRCMFTFLQVLSQTAAAASSKKKGNFELSNLVRVNPQQLNLLSKEESAIVQEGVSKAFCLRCKEMHICLKSSRRRTMMHTLAPMLIGRMGTFFSKIPHIVHVGISRQDNFQALSQWKNLMLKEELVPTSHGGSWCYERDWPVVLRSHGIEIEEATTTTTTTAPLIENAPHPHPLIGSWRRQVDEAEEEPTMELENEEHPAVRKRPVVKEDVPEVISKKHKNSCSDQAAFIEASEVHKAMEFVQDCQAYRQATKLCPEVIRSESPPSRYLEFHQGNVWDAATRLAAYWELRHQVFEQDAFVPLLTQALSEQDKDCLRLGLLVPTGQDMNGRTVLCVDRTRLAPVASSVHLPARLRGIFASFQILVDRQELRRRQEEGGQKKKNNFESIHLIRCQPTKLAKLTTQEAQLLQKISGQAFCTRVKEIHLLIENSSVSDLYARRTVMGTVIPYLSQKYRDYVTQIPHTYHNGSKQENLESLMRKTGHCFGRGELPTSFGGTWSYKRDWEQILHEYGLTCGKTKEEVNVNAAKSTPSILSPTTTTSSEASSSAAATESTLTMSLLPGELIDGDDSKPASLRRASRNALQERKVSASRRLRLKRHEAARLRKATSTFFLVA